MQTVSPNGIRPALAWASRVASVNRLWPRSTLQNHVTGCEDASPGAVVELLGPNAPLDHVAAAAGTVAHELLTRLGERAERVYVGAQG